MSQSDSPIVTFTRKLKEHKAFRNSPNRKLIYLIYLKLLLSEPFRWVEQKKYRQEIRNTDPERAPVFLIGHWRSGTTYAHNLLSNDPGFIYQTKYQNFFSDNFLTTEPFFKPFLTRIMNLFDPVNQWKVKTGKTMDLDTPSESDTALIAEISEVTYHWAHLFPRASKHYFDKYLFQEDISEKELLEWKATMKSLVNKVHLRNRQGRLLLKNPGDTARIEHLLEIYPNARFIFIHRNPYDVFYSNMKLWTNVIKTVSLQTISEREKKDLILYIYNKLHQKYLEQRQLLKPNQLVEIGYDRLIDSPRETLQHIYEKLELPGFDKALDHFMPFIENNAYRKKVSYNYNPEDVAEINKYWNFAFDLWQYPKLDGEEFEVNPAG